MARDPLARLRRLRAAELAGVIAERARLDGARDELARAAAARHAALTSALDRRTASADLPAALILGHAAALAQRDRLIAEALTQAVADRLARTLAMKRESAALDRLAELRTTRRRRSSAARAARQLDELVAGRASLRT